MGFIGTSAHVQQLLRYTKFPTQTIAPKQLEQLTIIPERRPAQPRQTGFGNPISC
jgi:hypothetical protein